MRFTLFVLFLTAAVAFAQSDSAQIEPAPTEPAPPTPTAVGFDKTTVRASEPQGVFESGPTGAHLTKVSVAARNVGRIPAKNVRISVTLPDGTIVALSGPSTLAPNEEVTYKSDMYQLIRSTKKLKANLTCDNCRR